MLCWCVWRRWCCSEKNDLNARRAALRRFSGKIIYNRAMPERLRTLRHCIFTGRVVEKDSGGRAAVCESAARPLRKSAGGTERTLSVIAARCHLPRRGRFCSACRQITKSSPFGGAGCDQREQTERVFPLDILPALHYNASKVNRSKTNKGAARCEK